jgi:hypothetical protein
LPISRPENYRKIVYIVPTVGVWGEAGGLSYADDMVLPNTSGYGIKKLIAISEAYAESQGLAYNVQKSQVIGEGRKRLEMSNMFLNGCMLQRVNK